MVLVGAAQQPADAVERVIAAAAVPVSSRWIRRRTSSTAANPEAHHMKRVEHPHGVWQGGAQR